MDSVRCRALLAAVDEGTISKAAEKLGYTPSGVSQLITALEDDLGFPVVDRGRRGVRPTEAGSKMLPAMREFVEREENIYQLAGEINGLEIGSVTIGTYPSVSAQWLPDVIREFEKKYPGIEIRLLEGIRQEICTWLDERTCDLGFITYWEPMEYDWFPLAEDSMIAVLPKDHPRANDRSYPVRECSREDFIMPAMGHDVDVERLMEKYDVDLNVKYQTFENGATIALIEKGLGMSVMNELCTLSWLTDAVKLPLDPPESVTLGIALPSYDHATPAVRKFVDLAAMALTREE